MEKLPKMLQYKTIKPKGFPNEFKRWEVLPQASSSNYNIMDVVRFQFKTDWYFDPYQTYMDIEVEFPQDAQNMGEVANNIFTSTTLFDDTTRQFEQTGSFRKKNLSNIPVYCLDGPATSLISEMIIQSNNREVERIQEYDVLGNLIADLGVPASKRANKKFEGYHYQGQFANFDQFKQRPPQLVPLQTPGNQHSADNIFQQLSQSAQLLSHDNLTDADSYLLNGVWNTTTGTSTGKQKQLSATFGNQTLNARFNSDLNGVTNKDNAAKSYFRNYAREYVLNDGSMGVDHVITRNSAPIHIASDNTTNTENIGASNMTEFNIQSLRDRKRVLFNHESSVNQFDYMCPGIQAIKYQNGVYQDLAVRGAAESISQQDLTKQLQLGVYKQVFHVPILSAVMGHLIPNDQWTLIPGKGCGEMTWEFRLNKFAFYSSGHLDNQRPQDADSEPNKQFNMNWKITKMSIRFDLWNFDQSVNSIIQNQMKSTGLFMNTQGFTLGPVQQILSTSQLRNNYQINNGILSLRNMYVMFLLNDYQRYNYCAKNFRISHNVKSMQLKIGNEFIPKQPILGNAGNIRSNNIQDDDVYPFLMELYRSQGEMFNLTNKSSITPFNFCLNDRVYDPRSRLHTQCQQAMLHENRAKGKAIYTIDMQADPFDDSVLTGYNTTIVRPIELILDCHINAGIQTRASTMYVWLHHDTICQFTEDGIITICYG